MESTKEAGAQLLAKLRATFSTHLLCSPPFPHASYQDTRKLTYDPILRFIPQRKYQKEQARKNMTGIRQSGKLREQSLSRKPQPTFIASTPLRSSPPIGELNQTTKATGTGTWPNKRFIKISTSRAQHGHFKALYISQPSIAT